MENLTHFKVDLYKQLSSNQSISNVNRACKVLSANSTNSAFAARWENIPETLLLNGSIGFMLLLFFLIMTHLALNRGRSDGDDYINQNLMYFLYGFRDPDRWYVVPRYEFLNRGLRHHKHEMNTPNLFIPPQLPIANPLDLLIDADSKYLSREESNIANTNNRETSSRRPVDQADKQNLISSNSKSKLSYTSKSSRQFSRPSKSAIDQNFLYPSVITSERFQASYLSRKLNRFFSMFFHITDSDLIYVKGIDAYEYLLFQRHLILIMFITTLVCIGVILPVNWFNTPNDGSVETSFQRTTIKNISFPKFYLAHILCMAVIVIATSVIMKSYRDSIVVKNETSLARNTVLIGNIPRNQRSRPELHRVFQENFQMCQVEAIQFVYNTSVLETHQMRLSSIIAARQYCRYFRDKYNLDIKVKQTGINEGQYCNGYCRLCSFFFVSCYHWPKEDCRSGLEFYEEQETLYRARIKSLCQDLLRDPSEYAFVTFRNNKQAKKVLERLARLKSEAMGSESYPGSGFLRPLSSINLTKSASKKKNAQTRSSESSELQQKRMKADTVSPDDPLDPTNDPHVKSFRGSQLSKSPAQAKQTTGQDLTDMSDIQRGPVAWSMRYAPHPSNVEYDDILHISNTSKLQVILLHLLMVVIFLFITTPNVILSILQRWELYQPNQAEEATGIQGLTINYLSNIVLLLTSILLPSLVALISKLIPYEDTSSKNHAMMWKNYLFLVLMILILPSIGMNSAQSFFFNGSDIETACLFPTDHGSYYINFVLTSIFLSTMLDLIRPVEIISYYFITLTGRSIADFEDGRQFLEREFSVGMQHTNVLLIFSTVMTYTISCPLIAPAGLMFLVIKHLVDHHQLYNTYFTKRVDMNMQNSIEVFVKVSLVLMMFQTSVSIQVDAKTKSSLYPYASWLVLVGSLFSFLVNWLLNCTTKKAPKSPKRNYREFCACFYLQRVFQDLLRINALPEGVVSHQSGKQDGMKLES